LAESERQLLSRAESTPLLLGAPGSALDLVMNGLYFDDEVPELISMAAVDAVAASGLATPIPLYVRFKARRFPIVGTTLDYFDFRGLTITAGRQLALLGECVVGAEVAERLGITAGDSLLSSPETVFDLAGVYPLNMKVAGVLARSHTPDDLAVFVDIKTAWVVQGLVHGHQDVTRTQDAGVIIEQTDDNVIANARLVEYTEINPGNIDSFHFHGTPDDYPLSAVITVPRDEKSATILRGRYLDGDSGYQLVVPGTVIDGLLASIFRIKHMLDAVILVVAVATGLALVLVFALSIRLRQREIQTVFRIGGSRLTIARLLAAEITLIVLVSGVLCAIALLLVHQYSDELVRTLVIR
ncbi:MAG: ABC transporter permease, partial [Gammaproteobacteria bacterium]|nr:ABC transporter permease [Gammaproteobacteria bacterium]